MAADRTYLRCLCSDHDMPTVAALPYLYFTLFEYRSCLHIFKKGTVALLMVLLDLAYHTEFCCESMETNSLNHIFACSFSLSAVFKNKAAICSYPSFFATDAK